MYISDNIMRRALANVYFIWGRGKTTIANRLREKHGFYVYSIDDARDIHMADAEPEYQPYMCRDYVREYGVKSFWELPKEVIADREKHFLQEITPMIIVDLVALSRKHKVIICEGDIDYCAVSPIAAHTVHLRNCGTKFDWFKRPDHSEMFGEIRDRVDLSEEEKNAVIRNAYASVAEDESALPQWVVDLNIKNIDWDDNTGIECTLGEVEKYFCFE